MDAESPAPFEELEHTADLALRVRGASLGDLVRHATLGLRSLLCASPSAEPDLNLEVEVRGDDPAALLVDWLNELLYLGELHQRIWHVSDIVQIDETSIRSVIQGAPCCQWTHRIKAATYHDIELQQDEGGLAITIVFDV